VVQSPFWFNKGEAIFGAPG